MNAKQQLIALIERLVPDDATMCNATFAFRCSRSSINWGTEPGPEVVRIDREPDTMDVVDYEHGKTYRQFVGPIQISITTNDLFGR